LDFSGKIVLKQLDLDIPAGKTTAIVGFSGSGKTTIAQLLMRIYDVTQGQIIIDGKYNIKDLELR
jgi:ABC-type multidrug transport system fused ATPase/permease subunit